MNGLIIVNAYNETPQVRHQISRLKEEFSLLNVDISVVKNDQNLIYIKDGKTVINFKPVDFILYLDKDRYIASLLEKAGYRLFNRADAINICDDKMLTHIALINAGIKMPTTISSPLVYSPNFNDNHLLEVEKVLSYPMIIKENYGSLGMQVYLVNNHEEAKELTRKIAQKPHIFQEFIASSKGLDYRLIVINHKVIAVMERKNEHSYLSNLASGGSAFKIDLPKEYLDMAIKASEILGLDYCGVDILKGYNNEPVLSEVNSNAFFEGIEKTTGINVARAYAEYIVSRVKEDERN